MEHTNQIAVKILEDEYYDYKHNPHNKWHYDRQYKMLLTAIERAQEETKLNTTTPHLPLGVVSGSASDFEIELYKLINAYASAGLKKPDLVHKMEYVTQSCRVS